MKKLALFSLGLVLIAGHAHAISRYNSTSLSCNDVQSIIASEGAAIFRYASSRNPSLTLYNRYVAHGGYCTFGEYAAYDVIPTADTGQCPVYYCKQRSYDHDIFPRG